MPSGSRFTRGQGFFGKVKAFTSLALGNSTNEELSQIVQISLASADILALHTTPVAVIAAPATGKAIVVDSVIFKMVSTATTYANGGAVSLVYHGGSTAAHAGSVPATVVNLNSAATTYTVLGPAVASNGTTVVAATGVDVSAASADFITGTGTAIVRVRYRIITLP